MTIETTANRISYTGSGTTGPFSFPYYFLADGDLTVIKTTIADGTEETLTLTTDYTVSGAGEAAGGSVTLVATLSSAYKLTIIRDPDILQPADYPANDRFPAATHEEALDRATMILQRLKDYIDRSFRLSDGDVSGISLILSNLSAGGLIAVNSAGTGIESIAAADVDLATVTAFIQTLLDDADAATARTTLGAAALGANTFTGLQTWKASADIASGATVDLTAATGNTTRITGTTATSAFTMTAGQWHLCIADGVWPLTYHATTNKLDTGADYTCQAGDRLLLVKDDDNIVHGMIFPALATQAEMEAGTGTGIRLMTPERVAQAIAALASGSSLTIGSFTAWTSGAYKDITGISGAKRITISPKSLSTSGTSNLLIQIGDATGGLKTSGYESGCTNDSATRATSTAGFIVSSISNTTYIRSGTVVLTLVDSSNNTWAMSGQISETGSGLNANSGGQVTLSGPLDRFRFTTVGGTDTGDAGGFGYSVEV